MTPGISQKDGVYVVTLNDISGRPYVIVEFYRVTVPSAELLLEFSCK